MAATYLVEVDGALVTPSTGLAATHLTVTSLSPFTNYSFRVLARNNGGLSAGDPITAETLQAAPARMEAPVVVPVNHSHVQAGWSAPSPVNGRLARYILYRNGSEVREGKEGGGWPVQWRALT